ncbi:MAG: AI-2E family transporter [Woeseiaceae bacterium]|nr:AI-2E family transporter [Woeseiaceae bacterium]
MISAAAIVVIVFGMQAASALLVPFLLAVFFAMIAIRPMLWLQSHRVPSALAALIIVIAMMLILGLVAGILGNSIADFTAQLPNYQARLESIVTSTGDFIESLLGEETDVENLTDLVDPGFAMGFAANILTSLQGVLTNTFLILFAMVFILLEAASMGIKANAAFGEGTGVFDRTREFLHNLGRYLGIKTIVSLATGFCTCILALVVGLDFPLLWGMLAFLFNYVPTIGSIIAAVPAVLLALIQLGVPEATTTAIGFLSINVIFGNIVEPRLMGYGVGISPLVVFLSLVLWGWIFGPVGMLLSVPLTMTVKMALEANEDTRWIAILIGSERDAEYALAQRAQDEENA